MRVAVSFPGFPFHLAGSIDGIVTDILEHDYLLEHKAINHFTFQKFWGGEIPRDYISQTCLYVRGLYDENPDITQAVLLIKNKNTAAYIEFIVNYDHSSDTARIVEMTHSNGERKDCDTVIEHICRDAFQKFADVAKHIEERTLPKRPYFIDDWHCEYCGWGRLCWENYKDEFGSLAVNTVLSEEIETMIRYYKELGAQKKDIEKEYDELSGKIKAAMKDVNSRQGSAGEYIVKIALIETNRLKPELLTETERAKATQKSFYERLSISSPKRKEVKENE